MNNTHPKLVPQPYTNLLTERDVTRRPILETRHLGIDFGGLTAVSDFNIAIGATEIAGLIGPNGAGKTTIFNLLTNVYKPTRGSVLLDGVATAGKTTIEVNHMGIARTFQNIRLFRNLTVLDNVLIALNEEMKYSAATAILRNTGVVSASQRSARWNCSAFSIWRRSPTIPPVRCRTVRSAAWRSFAHWRRTPVCCCSTSRQPA